MTLPNKNSDPSKLRHSWHRGRRMFRHALIPKLVLVLFATGLLINCTVGGFYRLMVGQEVHGALKKNVNHYGYFLAEEIGSPPDTLKAKALAERYSLRIRIVNSGQTWNSFQDQKMGRAYARVHFKDCEFIFATDLKQFRERHPRYFAIVLCLLSLILTGAFLMIRHLLSPLKKLSAGVERLGQGELGHQIPVCSHDEFGDLASSFNTMSSRLAALVKAREQLLLDVSHELRSPITRIKVALEMMPENVAKDVVSIGEDLREMETMIAEILEAARLESVHGKLNLEKVNLVEIIEEAIVSTSSHGSKIHFNAASTEFQASITLDKNRVRKVISNVLENALKFSQGQKQPIEVKLELIESKWTIRIQDYGVGIPPSEIVNLFEPFYRVDRSRSRDTGGYGLGLSLCKRIMEAHGGRIRVSSVVGSGTEISISFPVQADENK